MLGKRSKQQGLFESDQLYLKYVGADSFYGYLASQRNQLFRDDDFAELYCPDNGRPGVPPSQLAIALLLQTYDKVSDEEAKERADYDLRWKVALGIEVEERPFAKSTLQLFRSQLILNEKMRAIFQRSLEMAKETGYFKLRKLRVVLDTSNILGRGAVKDTYNLLADGIRKLMRSLAKAGHQSIHNWVKENGYERYLASSIKGEAKVNWDSESERDAFLKGIVLDVERLLSLPEQVAKANPEWEEIEAGVELLNQLIGQDIERKGEAVKLKEGVAKDRLISVQDPEMRHGRKSSSKRFNGYKAAIAVDSESQLITAVDVLAGNAGDATHALELTQESEANTGMDAEETVGDCAYGGGNTRQIFADAHRELVAKVAAHGRRDQISKEQFLIDLVEMICTCAAGQVTRTLISQGSWKDKDGEKHKGQAFRFEAAVCATCPLRVDCIKTKANRGRTVSLHPQEGLLQKAKAFQKSEAFKEYCQLRQVAEHRIARLMQLGIRQARYLGRKKTLFQLLIAATVANLTLVARKTGQMRSGKGRGISFSSPFFAIFRKICTPASFLLNFIPKKLAFRLCF
ncbi:MAG: IS1182 family transposase [Candidatus Omnitrophica bacterium]|nr:IS1182 family transposase [Candidatus Omnitrophota bacterium]